MGNHDHRMKVKRGFDPLARLQRRKPRLLTPIAKCKLPMSCWRAGFRLNAVMFVRKCRAQGVCRRFLWMELTALFLVFRLDNMFICSGTACDVCFECRTW
ncbi:unnamed protein product [Ectocarpus sp. 12 AP-2014]